ncbi:MAG: hypothetical protein ACK500_08845 [Flavobacteriales bacterium]
MPFWVPFELIFRSQLQKSWLVIISLSLTSLCFGQRHNTSSSIDIAFGSRAYAQSFYNALNTLDTWQFDAPVRFVGIAYSGRFYLTRGKDFDGHLSFGHILPERIQLNDSLSPELGGFVAGFAYGRDVFRGSELLDVILGIGFNTGRLRLNDGQLINQKNPFLAPKISLQPKLNLGRIALSVRLEYEYDISGADWRNERNNSNQYEGVSSFSQTSFTGMASIGYILNRR